MASNISVKKLIQAKLMAEIASDIYNPVSQENENWKRLDSQSIDGLGLRSEKFTSVLQKEGLKRYGLKVGLYQTRDNKLVVAFAGTYIPASSKELAAGVFPSARDWVTNFKQSMGVATRDYELTVEVAQALEKLPVSKIMTGHSKGGALASLAGAITHSPVITFNTAGLHKKTVERAGLDYSKLKAQTADKLITNFMNDGEVLQKVNGLKLVPNPLGSHYQIGEKVLLGNNSFKRHSMSLVIESLDEEIMKKSKLASVKELNPKPIVLEDMIANMTDPERKSTASNILSKLENVNMEGRIHRNKASPSVTKKQSRSNDRDFER